MVLEYRVDDGTMTYRLWSAFETTSWPRKYIADHEVMSKRYDHTCEGGNEDSKSGLYRNC